MFHFRCYGSSQTFPNLLLGRRCWPLHGARQASARRRRQYALFNYPIIEEVMSMTMRSFIAALVSIVAMIIPAVAAPVSGEAIYQKRCAACHDSANSRIPARETLKKLPA